MIDKPPDEPETTGPIQTRERLVGMLKIHYRAASRRALAQDEQTCPTGAVAEQSPRITRPESLPLESPSRRALVRGPLSGYTRLCSVNLDSICSRPRRFSGSLRRSDGSRFGCASRRESSDSAWLSDTSDLSSGRPDERCRMHGFRGCAHKPAPSRLDCPAESRDIECCPDRSGRGIAAVKPAAPRGHIQELMKC